MRSATLLSQLPANAKADAIASKLYTFIFAVGQQSRTLRFKRLIAAYFSCARYSEIERGIMLRFNPLNNSITSTYDYLDSTIKMEDKRKITLPVFDNAENDLAEKLFDIFTKNEYLLSNPVKLGVTIAALRKERHRLNDVFGLEFNTTALRTLRLYALLHDYGDSRKISKEVIWSLYLGSYAYGKFFGQDKGKIAEKAMLEIAKATEKTPFRDRN